MDDDRLRHLCKLSALTAAGIYAGKEEWLDFIEHADESELRNHHTCLKIMAEAFVELMVRAGMKPTLRVPAVGA